MKKRLKIGLDFDGVVAYNPIRIARAPIKWFKRNVLKINKLTFFIPKNDLERVLWIAIHESSVWPGRGVDMISQMKRTGKYEFYLVTARYGFLKTHLYKWLERYQLTSLFKEIVINENANQPHLFKEKAVKKLRLDFFVEDNLDIVEHLNKRTDTNILWIYNLVDFGQKYRPRFPYLEKALLSIRSSFEKK